MTKALPSHVELILSRILLLFLGVLTFGLLNAQGTAAGSGQEDGGHQAQNAENHCLRLLEKTCRPVIHKRIDASRPNVLLGEEGTQLLIPANAFVDEKGKAVSGEVLINFQEAYQKPDLVLSNLPTVSDGRMLESGGVIFVEALADGKQLKLAQGKSMLVNFPGGHIDGMEMFSGEYDVEGRMSWTPMSDANGRFIDRKPGLETTKGSVLPLFTRFGKASPLTFEFSDADVNVSAYIYTMLEKKYACRGQDAIYVEIRLNPDGTVESSKSLTGKIACYRLAIEELIRTIPWEMSKLNGRKTFYLELKLELETKGEKGENLFASAVGNTDYISVEEVQKTMEVYVERDRARNFTKTAFQVTKLGWINCDRFYEDQSPRVTAFVSLGQAEMAINSKVFMVFEDINSVIEGFANGPNSFQFSNIPQRSKVKIVALAYMPDDGPYISIKNLEVKNGQLPTMDLQKSSVEKVKATLKAI